MSKEIDYLFEDPVISNQKYALVSIVGPHMPQKCDTWGLKVRGIAENLDRAKVMSQKILKIDNDYDIYTVEVGKFFPLTVEPHDVSDVEYQNSQLNELVKNYLKNKELANDHWYERKNEMIQKAIKEGKNQEEMANKPEHPIAVLQRIVHYEQTIKETEEQLNTLKEDLIASKNKFENYTEEERMLANKEIQSKINPVVKEEEEEEEEENEMSINDIRKQIANDLNITDVENVENVENVEITVSKLKTLERDLEELNILHKTQPNPLGDVSKKISSVKTEIYNLKEKLNNKDLVNSYINQNYQNSQYTF
jgi:hypothetical protein